MQAVNNRDCDTIRSMVKYQRTILTELSTREAESLLRVATSLDNSVDMASLLVLEGGLKVESATRSFDDLEESKWMDKGWTELHVAAACVRLKDDAKHNDGCTTLHRAS